MEKNLLESKLITNEQWEEYQNQKRQIEIMEKYFELIIDIGCDYDGYNTIEGLKSVIDELCHYASLGRVANDTESMYIALEDGTENEELFNILHEKINIEK